MDDDQRKAQGRRKPDALFPAAVEKNKLPTAYAATLNDLRKRIRSERLRITMAANSVMVLLYWDIGNTTLERQRRQGWGAKVIDRLSSDLQEAFPEMKGLSPRNLNYIRVFAEAWPERGFVQRTVAQIPWRSNLALLDKLDIPETRLWYARKTIENRLHERHGKAVSNFHQVLPPGDPETRGQNAHGKH